MNYDKFKEEIQKLQEENTEESFNKIIELVDKFLEVLNEKGILSQIKENKGKMDIFDLKDLAKDAMDANEVEKIKKELNLIKEHANVAILELKLQNEKEKKDIIKLQGKLIKAYKKLESIELDNNGKYEARHKKLEYLQQQKDMMKDYRQTANDISIPKKVALKVKEIANSVKLFLDKKDIIEKLKNILKEVTLTGITSSAIIMGMGLAIQLATGLPTFTPSLASVAPIMAYAALTSGIRNFSMKTGFQQYEYYQSDEYKEYVKQFKEENKDKLKELQSLLKEKEGCKNDEELIQVNESLIKKLDEICSVIKVQGLRDAYALQALGYYRENKIHCKNIVNKYLNEENNDQEKYKKYNNKLSKINLQIFSRENSIKEALKSAGKGVVKNTAIIALAKAIVTAVVPESSIAIHGLNSFILPVAMAITNGLIEIPTYNGKLKYKETSDNVKIDVKEEEKFNQLFGDYMLSAA